MVAASGITEMVMQSHDGSINLIPAIPSDWQAGSFKGLKALGGATVDLTWSEGKPVEAKVTAATDGELKVRNKYMGTAVVKDSEGNVVTPEHLIRTRLCFHLTRQLVRRIQLTTSARPKRNI